MKKYQSHKVVEAAKILEATLPPDSDMWGLRLDGVEDPVFVDEDWFQNRAKGAPVGGYFVRYLDGDGYESWSPAEAFEAGYTEVTDDG